MDLILFDYLYLVVILKEKITYIINGFLLYLPSGSVANNGSGSPVIRLLLSVGPVETRL
jgi:hypothetical protein